MFVVVVHRIPLKEAAAHRADHEVGEAQPRGLAVEGEGAVRRPVVDGLDLRLDDIEPERDLMTAADDVEVIRDLERLRVEEAGVRAAVADREAVAGDVDPHVTLERADDLAAEFGGREVLGKRTIVECPVEGDVQRVDHRARDLEVVTEDE